MKNNHMNGLVAVWLLSSAVIVTACGSDDNDTPNEGTGGLF